MINVDLVVQYAREDKALSSSLAKEAIRYQADEIEALRGELEAKDKVLEYIMSRCENHVSNYALDIYNAADSALKASRKEEIDG